MQIPRLHSLVAFLGLDPLIYTNVSEKAVEFSDKFREVFFLLTQYASSFEDQRPKRSRINAALIIYERSFDPAVALHHSAHY